MNETMKPSCGEAYDATPVAVLAASETLTIALGMLTKSPVAAIVAGGLTGCVCSLALPAISGRILDRKRDAILSWWDENLEVYKKFKVENPDREPSKRAEKREERDLAIWWLDAMRLVRTKELMREKVEALIETGSRMPDGVNLDDYETVEFTMHELLVGALRERPDRIVVGECRDDETYEMLQAIICTI